MAVKKISELTTKSFLGASGAAANSYVLINYEDNSTSEPVTYKASLQELGKAIANDLKLPSVTVNEGAITNFKVKGVSNGAYTETVVAAPYDGPSMGAISDTVDTAISGLASTGYVTNAIAGRALPGASSEYVMGIINSHSLASEGYVTDAIAGFASTGYVADAVDGLASTGYVDDAVANAGGGFYPTASISCQFIPDGINSSDPIEGSLYPTMTDGQALYKGTDNGPMSSFVSLEKILFYDIYESDGGSRTLFLKTRDNTTIHSIPLN